MRALTAKEVMSVFAWGMDYGQLLMEQERDGEAFFDAAQCAAVSRRTCLPTEPAERRRPHSEAWRQTKGEGFKKFVDLMVEIANSSPPGVFFKEDLNGADNHGT
jgi:hypothetical protein